jgi:hypothetical protein
MERKMEKRSFFVLALVVIGISVANAQSNQALTAGQVFSATIADGAVHTYRIQLGNDPIYYIRWEEDNSGNKKQGLADISVTVRHSDDAFYRGRYSQDSGGIRLNNIKNPVFSGDLLFFPNSLYIIEVQGSTGGTYKIVFF